MFYGELLEFWGAPRQTVLYMLLCKSLGLRHISTIGVTACIGDLGMIINLTYLRGSPHCKVREIFGAIASEEIPSEKILSKCM